MQNFYDFGPKTAPRKHAFDKKALYVVHFLEAVNHIGFTRCMLYGWAAWLGVAALGGSGLLWADLGCSRLLWADLR